ncbi:transcriptional regulator [Cellvibrio sp. KY-GH-1]|uniref:Rho-binding antiterminator n=1 Tax=Cellvibrio sp. KY-GH-1 TaxID=2303332 RepID=UPI001243EBA2|nr:Rho-binding antiterminator [Cellvibrio sp. KY-GH-1]QEY16505.1 transcriptional regulator [Cellvibrio sp. KY-GH-1]
MISCNQHDYIEIVCMYRYPVKLTLKSGEIIEGAAVDTVSDELREECIKLATESGETLVVLNQLKQLEVTVENPHLKLLLF